MRKNVLIEKEDKFLMMQGISIIDFYDFFKTINNNIKVIEDIPSDDIDEVGSSIPFKQMKLFNLNKMNKIEHYGTTIMFLFEDEGQSKIYNYSQIEIYYKLKNNDYSVMDGILAYVDIHDFDWQAVCYLHTEELYNKFIEYFS